MDLELNGKRAIVTGGSRGIGLATARALTAEGVDVALVARSRGPLEDAATKLAASSGRKVVPIVADVRDDAAVRAAVSRTVEILGGIDILVNNASKKQGNSSDGKDYPRERLDETTDEGFWEDIDTKVGGYLRFARAVAPYLKAQGWGRIINISGNGARHTVSITRTIRNVSIVALTKNLADELGRFGINVSVVHPAGTKTEAMSEKLARQAAEAGTTVEEYEPRYANNAIGRLVRPDELAAVIAFLASPRSVAITGDVIAAGGGPLGAVYY